MKAADVLHVVAAGLKTAADGLVDPNEKLGGPIAGAVRGAAVVVDAVADMLTSRTPAECIEVLEMIRDKGAKGIVKDVLDAQTKATIAAALRG